ncbi:50S ribosomal protein L32 [Buchnera aphidicola (Thelaxes suberi)]|uniref:50S ribosomal protein L32 n=1 Tax=Buchnera aphidicola TaxID=9 RepID=UPI003463D7AF
MAVQKSKPSRSKRGMRRSHDRCYIPMLSKDKQSHEYHIRHHITKNGYYKGKLVLLNKKNK